MATGEPTVSLQATHGDDPTTAIYTTTAPRTRRSKRRHKVQNEEQLPELLQSPKYNEASRMANAITSKGTSKKRGRNYSKPSPSRSESG